ncbi:MAG: hypothetical protein ABR601_10620 [Parasphingopyxis sp.]|nr:hypothetical protein [Sphingomonadales bacterium]
MSLRETVEGGNKRAATIRIDDDGPDADLLTGLLGRFGLSRADFQRFLDTPYDKVMEQVRVAASGSEVAYPFMVRPHLPSLGFEQRITDPAPREAIDARHVIVDRPMHLYILRAVFRMTDAEFGERVDIRGWDIFESARASGQGVFLLNSHFGPAHLVPIVLARLGCRMTGLTSTESYRVLDINLGDRFTPIELTSTFLPKALAMVREALRAGGIVHSTGDGYATHSTVKRRFLDRYRPFADGAGYLCHQTGAHCLPTFVRSDEFGKLRIEFGEPLSAAAPDASLEQTIDQLTGRYIALLEQRWLTDFGNVSPHAIRRFAERATATSSG